MVVYDQLVIEFRSKQSTPLIEVFVIESKAIKKKSVFELGRFPIKHTHRRNTYRREDFFSPTKRALFFLGVLLAEDNLFMMVIILKLVENQEKKKIQKKKNKIASPSMRSISKTTSKIEPNHNKIIIDFFSLLLLLLTR